MNIIYSVVLFIAIVSTVLCITAHINSWLGIIVLKENYVDNHWFARIFNLIVAIISWITLYWIW